MRGDEASAGSITHRLAAAVTRLRFEDLPNAVVQHAKRLIADTLLVAAAGAAAAGCAQLRTAVPDSAGRSRLWFLGGQLRNAQEATFINTLHAVALDYDSINGAVHADAACLPAAWAAAEEAGASGRDLVVAYVAASEIVSRLSRAAASPSLGWSATALYGGVGAAAAYARLSGLTVDATRHALGLALSQAAGTQQANIEQVTSKRLQPAFAARHGVFSACLAAAGATAPAAALEGQFGLRALAQPGNDSLALQGLWSDWQFLDTAFKRYPVCACSHAAIAACLALRERHGLDASEVSRIEVRISPLMARLVGGAFTPNADPQVTAQFSLRYHMASCLLRGRMGLAEIAPDAVGGRDLAALAERVVIEVDENNTGELAPATVLLHTRTGRRHAATCESFPGSPQRPLTPGQWSAKLAECARHASPVVSPEQLQVLLDRSERLEELPDLSRFWEGAMA